MQSACLATLGKKFSRCLCVFDRHYEFFAQKAENFSFFWQNKKWTNMTELWRFFNICFLFLVICKDFYDFSSSFGRFMVLTGILLCHFWQKVHFGQSQFFLCLTLYYASVRFPLFLLSKISARFTRVQLFLHNKPFDNDPDVRSFCWGPKSNSKAKISVYDLDLFTQSFCS